MALMKFGKKLQQQYLGLFFVHCIALCTVLVILVSGTTGLIQRISSYLKLVTTLQGLIFLKLFYNSFLLKLSHCIRVS